MRRVATALVVAVTAVFGIGALADVTQSRPDAPLPGSHTEIDFSVGTRSYRRDEGVAAAALWAVCVATIDGTVTTPVVGDDGDHWTVSVQPALGTNGRKRLVGCLEDATIDRVLGRVVAVRTEEPPT